MSDEQVNALPETERAAIIQLVRTTLFLPSSRFLPPETPLFSTSFATCHAHIFFPLIQRTQFGGAITA